MRITVCAAAAAASLIAAAASAQGAPALPEAGRATVGLPALNVTSPQICRDRIQTVRRELGKPALEGDASRGDPLLIAAVDKRIGQCSVMVMRNDTSDLRPLPAPGEHRLLPAR